MSHAVYASEGWGIHDRRWVDALAACGFETTVVTGTEGVRERVQAAPSGPVLAGPLPSITRALVGLPRRLVGLSWGWDLQPGHERSPRPGELDWLVDLDALIVDSPSTADVAESAGLDPSRIRLIPWGIDPAMFPADGPVATVPSDRRVVVSLRRHDLLYRTSDVIEAFARAAPRDPALVLVMGGSGPLTDQHRKRVAELDLEDRVDFVGDIDESAIARLMRRADVYVSVTETDGTSVTLLQAMACRAPVIASRIPGNIWWIEEGVTGTLVDVGDVRALAERMLAVSRSKAVLDRAAVRVLERADWPRNRLALRGLLSDPHSMSKRPRST